MRTLRNIFSLAFPTLLCFKNFHSGGFGLPVVFFFSYCWKKCKESGWVLLVWKRKGKKKALTVKLHTGDYINLPWIRCCCIHKDTLTCHLNPLSGQGACVSCVVWQNQSPILSDATSSFRLSHLSSKLLIYAKVLR